MQGVYELRFQTYCQELGFLPSAEFPDGREVDEFDHDAAHFCEFDAVGRISGYVRLVRENAQRAFPFEHYCGPVYNHINKPGHGKAVEISRLILRQALRKRRGNPISSESAPNLDDQAARHQATPSALVLPKLYRQMFQYSLASGVDWWFAAMERPLARSLTMMGYPFRQVTPVADYHGPVATYLMDLAELQTQLQARNPGHLAWLHDINAPAIPGTMPPQLARVEADTVLRRGDIVVTDRSTEAPVRRLPATVQRHQPMATTAPLHTEPHLESAVDTAPA